MSAITLTVQDAEKILVDRNVSELIDHPLSNGAVEFRLSFSMKPNAGQDIILTAGTVANDLTSVLEHLGSSYQLVESLFGFAYAASELHPIAKAVLASVDQVNKILHVEDKCVKDIRDLVADMAHSLNFITDVKQFAKLDQLKRALEEVDHLMRNTANFISRYSSRSPGSRIILLTFSATTRDELDELTRNFRSFKERFDRCLAVQSGLVLADLQAQ
ncbi:hypothetical protein DFH09DRAFT_976723, partial [Mycena vulgaris]